MIEPARVRGFSGSSAPCRRGSNGREGTDHVCAGQGTPLGFAQPVALAPPLVKAHGSAASLELDARARDVVCRGAFEFGAMHSAAFLACVSICRCYPRLARRHARDGQAAPVPRRATRFGSRPTPAHKAGRQPSAGRRARTSRCFDRSSASVTISVPSAGRATGLASRDMPRPAAMSENCNSGRISPVCTAWPRPPALCRARRPPPWPSGTRSGRRKTRPARPAHPGRPQLPVRRRLVPCRN